MGQKALDAEQRREIGKGFAKHIPKGIAGLIGLTNLAQLACLLITNKLKEHDIIEGEEVPLHLTFQNESKRHWFDIDTGLVNKKGQRIYVVAPVFRYIRDYIGWATEPGRTMYNKIEPVLKQAAEQLFNYSRWRDENIVPKGAPTWDAIKLRARYFVEGITPAVQLTGRKGQVRTLPEILIPFTGTWIRRGAPGGKFTGLIFKYREEKGYKTDKVDDLINEQLQSGELEKAFNTMAKEQRNKV